MEESTPPPATPTPPTVESASIAQSTAAFPPVPSPSTVPEPPMVEPGTGATLGLVVLVVGGALAIVILLAGISVSVVFAIRSYSANHPRTQPVTVTSPQVSPVQAPPMSVAPPVAISPSPAAVTPTPPPLPIAPPVEHGPFVGSMSPTAGNVGDTITLHGRGLGAIEDVILFPQHGGDSIEAAIQSTDDRVIKFAVPAVGKVEGLQPGDGYYVGVFSKTGACLFVDGSFRSTTPTDPAGMSHDAVRVKFNSPLVGRDHLLVFGDTGATVSVGTNCIVLLRPNCLLKDYGGGCKIFYMPPLRGMSPDADGLIPMTDVRLSAKGSRLMLKPLGDPGVPPDPNP